MQIVSRRTFISLSLLGLPAASMGYAWAWEAGWLRVRHIRHTQKPTHRFVHFTDTHHKGNRRHLRHVMDTINGLSPDFICFTGDLIEEAQYVDEALEEVSRLQAPVYGCPGNHDYWSGADFGVIAAAFKATGGAWLTNETRAAVPGAIGLVGITDIQPPRGLDIDTPVKILLGHYPETAGRAAGKTYTLILAGHSHGGQIRFPIIGAPMLPGGCGSYDRGMFDTPAGPLYVNTGIGTWLIPMRFMCRPEIVVFEV